MTEQNIKINYERLKRHYEFNIQKFDEIALYDLAHSLRMWTDMEKTVSEYLLNIQPKLKFKSYSVSKQLNRLVNHKEYIISSFPGGITTWAGNPEIITNSLGHDISVSRTQSIKVMFGENNITVGNFILIYGYVVPNEQSKILKKGIIEKSYNFSQWLNSEVIRIQYPLNGKLVRKIIPRRIFINRVANILGGSHPIGVSDSDNQFNDAVKYLMGLDIIGLPAPYLIIMKIAKEILDKITVPNKV